MYENLIKKEDNVISRKENDVKIVNHYVDGGYLEILSDLDKSFKVEFFKENGDLEYSCDLKSNMWCRTSKKYFEKYTCKVHDVETGETIYDETYNAKGKTVLISLDSKSLGDTMAWFPYVEEFRKKWDCEVICSTFWNSLFEAQYPNIKFVNPGYVSNSVYACYKIGLYFTDGKIDIERHKNNPTQVSLLQMSADILGIDYVEVKPILRAPKVEKRKRVGIGVHSTAQTKYWNNATGWQEVTDFLISEGYEVVVMSKEEDGYMGNYYPKGSIKLPEESVEDLIDNLHSCEFFIGLSSGLSWLAWATRVPVVLISGFTSEDLEPKEGVIRIMNKNACSDCWSRHKFDPSDWNWCPDHKGTERQFECSKLITGKMVINKILSNNLLSSNGVVEVEVSVGELLDKLTILEIKKQKITDPEKLVHIEKEYRVLMEKSKSYLDNIEIESIVKELLEVNSKLWVVEDILRDLEADNDFGDVFIENARLVYKTNDFRFELKNKINKITNSSIQEQKSYKVY
jgi:autotransporter strand-loop-strand O-heptosyltransferase